MIRELTETEMNFVSGGDRHAFNHPTLLSAGGAVTSIAQSIWNAPNTIIGVAIGTLGFAVDHIFGSGDAFICFGNGGIVFGDNPFMMAGTAITLGQAQIYSDGKYGKLAGHELQHTIQSSQWGPFFLPAYGIAGLIAVGSGGEFFRNGNFFEKGPYSDPPTPY